jgi:hypoxanthine phosphoribosyltransferase
MRVMEDLVDNVRDPRSQLTPRLLVILYASHRLQILIPHDRIAQRVREIAADISRDYRDVPDLHLIGVLKGAFVFMADLVRALDRPITMDFMAVSSYADGTTSSGEVRVLKDLDSALQGRHVLIVEDIIDTGLTLQYLRGILGTREPRSLRTACLLSKPTRRTIDVSVEYIGFEIEDQFVVGYGLDRDGLYRNLPDIVILGSG